MFRLAIVLALFVSLCLLIKGVSSSWRQEREAVQVMEQGARGGVSRLPAKIALQPPVPGMMPDLNSGYLFNAARQIEGGEPGAVDDTGTGSFINADVNKLVYSGSIIGHNFRKAIVSFPVAKEVGPKLKLLNRRVRTPAKLEHALLKEGDTLSSYRVQNTATMVTVRDSAYRLPHLWIGNKKACRLT